MLGLVFDVCLLGLVRVVYWLFARCSCFSFYVGR